MAEMLGSCPVISRSSPEKPLYGTKNRNLQEDVVSEGEADPSGGELAGQPAMSVAIELEAKRAPSRHAQIDQPQLGVDEVEVIMQALAAVRPQEGAMRALVVPGLVAVTGFHRRDDMDEAGMIATDGKHLGDNVLLADMVFAICSMETPAALANSAARSRTRSRSGSANRG